MFSEHFYQTQDEIKLEKTAIPTGILQNPLDLINSTKPWVTVKSTSSTKMKLPKIIIYADYIYNNRHRNSRSAINKHFIELKKAGFVIWVLSKESFVPIDKLLDNSNAEINITRMSNAAIRQLACKTFDVNASQIYILKYLEMNEAYLNKKNVVQPEDFIENPDDLTALLSQMREFHLLINTAPPQHFLQNNSQHLQKCKSLETRNLKIEHIQPILDATLTLEEFTMNHYGLQIQKANLSSLKTLRKINCDFITIDADDFADLLNNLPNLEDVSLNSIAKEFSSTVTITKPTSLKKLCVNNIKLDTLICIHSHSPHLEESFCRFTSSGNVVYENIHSPLQPSSLLKLKTIRMYGWPKEAEKALLLAAPNLTELDIHDDIEYLFENLPLNYLQYLTEVTFPSSITSTQLKMLLRAAPNLKELELRNCPNVANAFSELQPLQLNALEKIDFSSSSTPEDMLSVVRAAPYLNTIYFPTLFSRFFESLQPGQLANLTAMNFLYGSDMTEKSLTAFLRAIKKLTDLDMTYNDLNPDLSFLSTNQLSYLKIIYLNASMSAENIAHLLRASPNVEIVDLRRCVKLETEVFDLNKLKFPKLCKIHFPNNILSINAARLLEASEKITELGFNPLEAKNFKNVFRKLKPKQFTQLTSINLQRETTPEDLLALCLAAPNIKDLCLSKNDTRVFEQLEKNYFASLRHASIGGLTTSKSLNALLHAAPNLTSLRMGAIAQEDFQQFISFNPNVNLDSLTELRLIGHISKNTFSKILSLPNLESLDLQDAMLVQDNAPLFIDKPIKLRALVLPIFSNTDDLFAILHKTPVLNRLELGRCLQKKLNQPIEPKKLEYLTRLTLVEGIDKDILYTLLTMMPKLITLHVNLLEGITRRTFKKISGAFEKLNPNQLELLWQISDEFYQHLTEKDWQALELASPCINASVLREHFSNSNKEKELSNEIKDTENHSNANDTQESSSNINDKESHVNTNDTQESLRKIKDNEAHSNANNTQESLNKIEDDPSYVPEIPKQQIELMKQAQLQDAITAITKNTVTPRLTFIRYFPNIEPTLYRLCAWKPDLKSKTFPSFVATPPDDLTPISLQSKKNDMKVFPGLKLVTALEARKTILPSLDPNEVLTHLQVINSAGEAIAINTLELCYSKSTHFYWLTLPEGAFTIYLEVGVSPRRNDYFYEIDRLKKEFQHFSSKSIFSALFDHVKDFDELATYVAKHATGACLERSLLAYQQLSPHYNIWIIGNDAHAFVETDINGICQSHNLGGAPSVLIEKKLSFKPFELKKEKKVSTLITTPAPIIEQKKPELIDAIRTPLAALIQVENIGGTIAVINALSQHYSPTHLFTVHNPDELSLTAPSLDNEGVLKINNTFLQNFLSGLNGENAALVIDIQQFTLAEIAQLNEILDRRLDGQVLKDNIHIKLIDKIDRQYGPDLKRRIAIKVVAPVASDDLLTVHEAAADGCFTIDLFNSPYWQNTCIGSWDLLQHPGDSKLSFHWKDGALVSLYKKSNGQLPPILFLNPPLQDQSFLNFLLNFKLLKQLRFAHTTAILSSTPTVSYKTSAYAWNLFKNRIGLTDLHQPYLVLSDANILSFIKDPLYTYDEKTNRLVSRPSHLSAAKDKGEITIFLTHRLSQHTLAQLLDEAQRRNIKIKLALGSEQKYEDTLLKLFFSEEEVLAFQANITLSPPKNIRILAHKDAYAYVAELQLQNSGAYRHIMYFDSKTLDGCDLQRFPKLPSDLTEQFLKNGKFDLYAPLSDIINALLRGQHVVLYGSIPASIHEALSQLASGKIEGHTFNGLLTIVATEDDLAFLQTIVHQPIPTVDMSFKEKLLIVQNTYPSIKTNITDLDKESSLIDIERMLLQRELDSCLKNRYNNHNNYSYDEDLANLFDEERLFSAETALRLNPWVMVEGPTGIGKTDFLQKVLAGDHLLSYTLDEWFKKPSILVFDEASFNSELSGLGAHFFDRFITLRNKTPAFYHQGKYVTLTKQHKVIFLFNPATYGAGRDTSGFLSKHALNITFKLIPDYYLRARILFPTLTTWNVNFDKSLYLPFISVFNWIIQHSFTNEVLITPRELKTMVNLFVNRVGQQATEDNAVLAGIAAEIAYDIGKQTLLDHEYLLSMFNQQFQPKKRLQFITSVPIDYLPYQHTAYFFIKSFIESAYNKINNLGLGAIILEGGSNIGKSFFADTLTKELSKKLNIRVFPISPTMPFYEKEKQLLAAAECKGIVVADEFNTSIWPNKLLNNLVMGLDKDGKERPNYGVVLVGTQNPTDYEGRFTIDPAFRKRSIFFQLDWPTYKPRNDYKQLKMFSVFAPEQTTHHDEAFHEYVTNTIVSHFL